MSSEKAWCTGCSNSPQRYLVGLRSGLGPRKFFHINETGLGTLVPMKGNRKAKVYRHYRTSYTIMCFQLCGNCLGKAVWCIYAGSENLYKKPSGGFKVKLL